MSKMNNIGGYELAEEVTGICRNTLYYYVHKKKIPHSRIGGRLIRFNRDTLIAWLQANEVKVKKSGVYGK